jgi:chromosome segregation ATPase
LIDIYKDNGFIYSEEVFMAENTEKEFQTDDIQAVKDLQARYATNTAQIGQVEVELHLLKRRLIQIEELRTSLFTTYDDLQKAEKELVEALNQKYGDGVLDLDSGRFIPSTQ